MERVCSNSAAQVQEIRNYDVYFRRNVDVRDVDDWKLIGNLWSSVVDRLDVIRNCDVALMMYVDDVFQ